MPSLLSPAPRQPRARRSTTRMTTQPAPVGPTRPAAPDRASPATARALGRTLGRSIGSPLGRELRGGRRSALRGHRNKPATPLARAQAGSLVRLVVDDVLDAGHLRAPEHLRQGMHPLLSRRAAQADDV